MELIRIAIYCANTIDFVLQMLQIVIQIQKQLFTGPLEFVFYQSVVWLKVKERNKTNYFYPKCISNQRFFCSWVSTTH